jgi:hypothetical protein
LAGYLIFKSKKIKGRAKKNLKKVSVSGIKTVPAIFPAIKAPDQKRVATSIDI